MVFGERDISRFSSPYNDPMVVEIKIASAIVRRILIDTGSSMDIITWDCLSVWLRPYGEPYLRLWGIGGESHGNDPPPTKTKTENETNINETEGRELHVGFSTILVVVLLRCAGLSFWGVGGLVPNSLTLGRRRDKCDLLRVATLRGGPLTLIYKVKMGLEISIIFKFAGKAQHDLTEVPEGIGVALLVALLLSLDRISHELIELTLQPFLLGPPTAFHSTVGIARRAPPVASTPRQPSPLERRPQPWLSLPQTPWEIRSPRGCQVPGFNYVLDEIDPDARVRLDEGRGTIKEALLATGVTAPYGAPTWQGSVPPTTGSPIGEGLTSRLLPPPPAMGAEASASPGYPSVLCFFQTGKLTAGLFPLGIREGACKKRA
ncbi:hypothetical protein Cgig2_030152 [Carnegiea gigantea]|uniref:Uncharacterized protein n=1 Tax=Carnegiea gigantea TaxID=171969 RepID=A0A9Q1K112_9CARY|nr:hypothetical protein Cgig2_030152 [Carnegiea gigantea]